MKTKNTENIAKEDVLHISAPDWARMKLAIASCHTYQKFSFGEGFEFRFIDMHEHRENSYSALLSFNGLDVFHFMWTEVEGLVDVTHRIVNPRYRGQGLGTEVMRAIEDRVQFLSNRYQLPYHLMIETTQISVVKLGMRVGMQVAKGRQVVKALLSGDHSYDIDAETHVSNASGYRIPFRVSERLVANMSEFETMRAAMRNTVAGVLYS